MMSNLPKIDSIQVNIKAKPIAISYKTTGELKIAFSKLNSEILLCGGLIYLK